jgi:ribonuclease BN (tRNA processing enzyme)
MTVSLKVLGCGEAFDSGIGNTSVLLSGRGVPTVLLDCGYQIPERLWALPKAYPGLQAVVLTHFHADHAFGVAPLLMRFMEERRKAPLTIIGPRGARSYCFKALELAYPGAKRRLEFEIHFLEVRPGDSISWNGLQLDCARSRHSVLNLAWKVAGKGFSFALSGDGEATPATRDLFEGVDVLLHEVYSAEPLFPGHGNLKTLSKFLRKSAIERLGITHICRNERTPMKQALQKLKRSDSRWFLITPGMEIRWSAGSRREAQSKSRGGT